MKAFFIKCLKLFKTIQTHYGSGDNVSGKKVIIENTLNIASINIYNSNELLARTEELCNILTLRAKKINRSLNKYYKYTPVKEYLLAFNDLHIKALKRGDLVTAHEILIDIHQLSKNLQESEFSKAQAEFYRSNPGIQLMYQLDFSASYRGQLICTYIINDKENFNKYPMSSISFNNWLFVKKDKPITNKQKVKETILIYNIILISDQYV